LSRGVVMPDPGDGNRPTGSDNSAKAHWCPPAFLMIPRTFAAARAARTRLELVGEFNDAAVSGADPIESRPGFAELLTRLENNGVRVVIVEDASRFARDLVGISSS
jgi:hypothetical protein